MGTRTGGFRIILVIALLGVLTSGTTSQATQLSGGKGLTIVQFPTLLHPGALNVKLHSRAYAKSLEKYTVTNGTGAVSFQFGFSKHIEIGFTQILYQDLNLSALDPNTLEQIPDDTYLRLKWGNMPFTIGNAYFKFGILNQLRIRTGVVDNIILEPYVGNGIEWEFDLLISYYSNPLYEESAPALHFNVGYLNHNDAGTGMSPFKAAQEFVYSAAFVYPTRLLDLFIEPHGNFFTNYPDAVAYSREHSFWVTPGFTWKMFYGLHLTLAGDLRVWEEEDKTELLLPDDYPNYPEWRVNGILSFSPSTSFFRQPTFAAAGDAKNTRKLLRDRKSLFEWVVDDQEGLEYIDIELEKIKAERKEAEEDLEELKQELQGQ
jgi:hypothetical protein